MGIELTNIDGELETSTYITHRACRSARVRKLDVLKVDPGNGGSTSLYQAVEVKSASAAGEHKNLRRPRNSLPRLYSTRWSLRSQGCGHRSLAARELQTL